MYNEKPIGKKVNLLEGEEFNLHMTDKVYEVVRIIPWSPELNDWCEHYVLRNDKGEEIEIPRYKCVAAPDYTKDTIEMVYDFLRNNDIYAEVYEKGTPDNIVPCVHIERGDWKHGHLACQVLMGYLGFTEFASKVTEENGSDTYSAIHYFQKTSNYDYYRK